MTDIVRGPQVGWNLSQLFQELLVILLVAGVRAGKASRIDTGLALKRINDQAAIFAENPRTEM